MGSIWLTDLPAVIRAAGLKVTTWPGWEARANKRGGYEAIYGIAVHHTAGNSDAPQDCRYMWDNAALKPIGAIHLARDGSVTVGAAGQTNCQGLGGPFRTTQGVIPKDRGNSYAIAIEAANNGIGEPWPQAQQDAYVTLCAALCGAYGLRAADVFAHHEWTTRKIDPAGPSRYGTGKWGMDACRADVADAMTPPQPPQPEDDHMTAAKVFRVKGDIAQFAVVGGMARWITSAAERQRLDFTGQTQKGSLIECDRSLLLDFVLVGPEPAYGGDWTGGRTVANDFGAHA